MSENGQVVWEDPPPGSGPALSGSWIKRLAPLMARPGVWANLGEFSTSTASHLRRGAYAIPGGRWEFTQRRLPDTKGPNLYARYLGPEDER